MHCSARHLLVAAAAPVLLTAAGCSGGGDGPDADATPSYGPITPGSAELGQCANLEAGDRIEMTETSCNGDHDAEIVGVAEVTADNIDTINTAMAGYCAQVITPEDLDTLSDYLDKVNALIEDPARISVGDHLVCYVEADGLDAPLL